MSFEEFKVKRRIALYQSIGAFIVVLIWAGMLGVMYTHNVSDSNFTSFEIRTRTIIMIYVCTFTFLSNRKLWNIQKQHPEWVKQTGFKAKIPVPKEAIWKIIGMNVAVTGILCVMFSQYYKPDSKVNYNQFQQYKIIENNNLGVTDQQIENAQKALQESIEDK